MNPDLNAIIDANTPAISPFDLNSLFGFQLPTEITNGIVPITEFFQSIIGNLSIAETGLIISLFFLAIFMLRAKEAIRIFLLIATAVIAVIVIAILFGQVNF